MQHSLTSLNLRAMFALGLGAIGGAFAYCALQRIAGARPEAI
jgi:hypothetical protein